MRLHGLIIAAVVGGLSALVFGPLACSSKLPHPPFAPHVTADLVEVQFPPPPARTELVVEQPADNAVWLDGEWTWRGRRWSWKVGRWVVAPPGATYSPWTAVRNEEGTLFFAPGSWRNAKGEPITAPTPLALGVAKSGALVNAEGETEHPGRNDTRERGERDGGRDGGRRNSSSGSAGGDVSPGPADAAVTVDDGGP